jgi:hypothetical protein
MEYPTLLGSSRATTALAIHLTRALNGWRMGVLLCDPGIMSTPFY